MSKLPLVVNVFGIPNSGKSTLAAGLFWLLNQRNELNIELVTEYAKKKTWLEDFKTLNHQPYVSSKQFYHQSLMQDKVDIIITDSPFILGCVYGGFGVTPSFNLWLVEAFNLYTNFNLYLRPTHKYNTVGRYQTEDEAKGIDCKIKNLLDNNNLPYIVCKESGTDLLFKTGDLVLQAYNELK